MAVAVGTLFAVTVLGRLHIFKVVSLSLQLPAEDLTEEKKSFASTVISISPSPMLLTNTSNQELNSKDVSADQSSYALHKKLVLFYRKFNPEKLEDHSVIADASNLVEGASDHNSDFINKILIKYSDREEELWSNLQRKYNLTESDLYALWTPPSASQQQHPTPRRELHLNSTTAPARNVVALPLPSAGGVHVFGRFACHRRHSKDALVRKEKETITPNEAQSSSNSCSSQPITNYARCKVNLCEQSVNSTNSNVRCAADDTPQSAVSIARHRNNSVDQRNSVDLLSCHHQSQPVAHAPIQTDPASHDKDEHTYVAKAVLDSAAHPSVYSPAADELREMVLLLTLLSGRRQTLSKKLQREVPLEVPLEVHHPTSHEHNQSSNRQQQTQQQNPEGGGRLWERHKQEAAEALAAAAVAPGGILVLG